jgi:hypothetical protein
VGLRDILLGRSKSVAPNLDNLFALPAAGLTLESRLDLVTSGVAGLCFKAGSGGRTLESEADMRELLSLDEADNAFSLTHDDLGFTWVVINDPTLDGQVTKVHGANLSLVDHDLGDRLLCAVFGFKPLGNDEGPLRLVYLMKQGTFYPFAQRGPQDRDNEFELRVKSFLTGEISLEADLARWMALWNAPVE